MNRLEQLRQASILLAVMVLVFPPIFEFAHFLRG